jgi:hypothetical protein
VHDAGHAVALVGLERHGLGVLEVDEQPALEHEEELVLVVVLVPVEVALDDTQAHDGVVDLRQRLVEPRLMRGGLGRDVDERAVGVLDDELDVVRMCS